MSEIELHSALTWVVFGFAGLTLLALLLVTAPYGRHLRAGWGPGVPSRVGWILMECPSVIAFAAIYFAGEHRWGLVPLALFMIWQSHYFHRTFIFPFRMRSTGKQIPLMIALMGTAFNSVNSYLNARWISELGAYPEGWLSDPRFIIGALVFGVGLVINLHSDTLLLRLRKPGESGYKIPRGGFYKVVSCPNYLGEIVEWVGWAIATWSLAGLAFAIYTTSNLLPRALSNHRWYRDQFTDYPPERKALIPFVL